MSPSSPAETRQTIAVVGLGGIGAGIAGALLAAGHDVTACARRPIERLVLERAEGAVELPLRTLIAPEQAGRVDWVLLCTKAHHTESAGAWLTRLCGPQTRVAVLQNGIDHAARVAPYIGGAAVVPTIVYYNGERLADDRVRLRRVSNDDLVAGDDAAGRAFARLIEGTGLHVMLSDQFTTLAWRKLLLNVVVNPITALTLQRQAVLRRDDVYRLSLAILAEAIAVGRAEGAALTDEDGERVMATLMSFSPELGTSMYFDRLAGRALEIEALTGAVVAAAERHGLPTPINLALLTLLRAVSDAAAAQSG